MSAALGVPQNTDDIESTIRRRRRTSWRKRERGVRASGVFVRRANRFERWRQRGVWIGFVFVRDRIRGLALVFALGVVRLRVGLIRGRGALRPPSESRLECPLARSDRLGVRVFPRAGARHFFSLAASRSSPPLSSPRAAPPAVPRRSFDVCRPRPRRRGFKPSRYSPPALAARLEAAERDARAAHLQGWDVEVGEHPRRFPRDRRLVVRRAQQRDGPREVVAHAMPDAALRRPRGLVRHGAEEFQRHRPPLRPDRAARAATSPASFSTNATASAGASNRTPHVTCAPTDLRGGRASTRDGRSRARHLSARHPREGRVRVEAPPATRPRRPRTSTGDRRRRRSLPPFRLLSRGPPRSLPPRAEPRPSELLKRASTHAREISQRRRPDEGLGVAFGDVEGAVRLGALRREPRDEAVGARADARDTPVFAKIFARTSRATSAGARGSEVTSK